MDFIEENIKIYVSRKWIENVQHEFICSEFNKNNVQYFKSTITLKFLSIHCQSIARSAQLARYKALVLLFDELKLKSMFTEEIVLQSIGVEKEASSEKNIRSISEKLFKEGPRFISLQSKHIDSYRVTLGKVIFEIKEDISETFRIIFSLIKNIIMDMFENKGHIAIKISSIITIQMAEEKCTLKENKDTNRRKTISNIERQKVNVVENNSDLAFAVDPDAEHMKFFNSKGLDSAVSLYLSEIIEYSIKCKDIERKAPSLPTSEDGILRTKLNLMVSSVLNELVVTFEITADDYDVLMQKISAKIVASGEKKLDAVRIRDFVTTYTKSYKSTTNLN